MKNKIVISIGSLLACIALVSVLIAAVGPPPILRNSMTTNQNVWEKSGSSMTWTGNVAVAGTVSASVATNATNVVTLGQMSPGSNAQVLFQKGVTNGTDSLFVWDYTNHFLGIGTSFPSYKLSVYGPGSGGSQLGIDANGGPYSGIDFNSSGTRKGLITASTTTNYITLGGDSGYGIIFSANSTESMRLDDIGRFGIGTQPINKLDVNGGVAVGAYAGSVAAPANGLAVSGVQTNGSNIGIAGVYQAQGSVGISTSEKIITQAGTTNLNVWVGGILVSNITNYHD